MDLIGASELLISCPSTRTIRCQAERSSARSTRLRSESTRSWCGQAVLAEGAAPHLPAARAAGEGGVQGAGRFAVEDVTQADGLRLPAEQPLGGLAQKTLAAAVDQPEPPRCIEGEDGDVDLLDHPTEERGGLELPEPLSAEGLAQRVHLQQRQTERVVRAGAPRADRVVALAQRREQVGDGLQRADDPLPQQRGADEPGSQREQRKGEPHPQRVGAGPEQPAGDQHRRKSGQERGGEDPRFVARRGDAAGQRP